MQGTFVVGCGRSGTTLIQSILGSHSRVISFPETHFFNKGFRKSQLTRRWQATRSLPDLVRQFATQNEVCAVGGHSVEDFARSLSEMSAVKAAHAIIDLFDDYARSHGVDMWLEKTPAQIMRIALMALAAPNARFVHVVRRPEAVLPSLFKASAQWGRAKTWTECAVQWLLAVNQTYRYRSDHNHAVVFYEDFVADPAGQAKWLAEWLQLSWEDSMLENYTRTAEQVITSDEVWKQNNLAAIHDRNQGTSLACLPLHCRLILHLGSRYASLYEFCRRVRAMPIAG